MWDNISSHNNNKTIEFIRNINMKLMQEFLIISSKPNPIKIFKNYKNYN